jgi:hypothetical protein
MTGPVSGFTQQPVAPPQRLQPSIRVGLRRKMKNDNALQPVASRRPQGHKNFSVLNARGRDRWPGGA